MSVTELNNLTATLQAIEVADIKKPNIPIDIYIQEAENLYTWCQDDKEQLINAGLTDELIEELKPRAGALRQAESDWFKERYTKEDAERTWLAESKDAYELRDQLLHHFHFAYRKAPDLANRVSAIAEGSGHADMIQDLNDLAVLGNEYSEYLIAINFDLNLLTEAAETADRLSEVLALANAEDSGHSTVELRNRAYTYLKEVVDEIRTTGQYLFWRNAERLKGYASNYRRKMKSFRKRTEIIGS